MATLDEVKNSCVYNRDNLYILLSLNSDKNDFVKSLGHGPGSFKVAEKIFRRIYEQLEKEKLRRFEKDFNDRVSFEGEQFLVARAINLCFKLGIGSMMDAFNKHEVSKSEICDFNMLQDACISQMQSRNSYKKAIKSK